MYSQAALRIKPICTTPDDFNQHCEELKQRFVNHGYKPELINKHTKAAEKMDRKKIKNKETTSPRKKQKSG